MTQTTTPAERTNRPQWEPDVLGPNFAATRIELGNDPDGEGPISAVLTRYTPAAKPSNPAVLMVHGMSDYFFQAHVAEFLAAHNIACYGIDLRKCGRANQGQRFHYATDMRCYQQELNAAVAIISGLHQEIFVVAHSTGGLIAPLWLSDLAQAAAKGDQTAAKNCQLIKGLVLNSPWLGLMAPEAVVRPLKKVVQLVGKKFPLAPFKAGSLNAYGESIHQSYFGRWDFNLAWKPVTPGHPMFMGWIRAVSLAQDEVQAGKVECFCPILTLCSTKSLLNKPYSYAANFADTVVDVQHSQKFSLQLGRNVKVEPICGARHDVFLSEDEPRAKAFSLLLEFIEQHTTSPNQ